MAYTIPEKTNSVLDPDPNQVNPTHTDPDAKIDGMLTSAEWAEVDALGSFLNGKFTEWQASRRPLEVKWLDDLRAFNAITEPDASRDSMHSDIFVQLTRTKCLTAYARITDTLFQNKDEHWSVVPTPNPDFVGKQPVVPDPVTGEMVPVPESVLKAVAKEKAEAMSQVIADQLVELGYEDIFKSAILEACVYGTGAIKGVVPGVSVKGSWKSNAETQAWEFKNEEIPFPDITAVSIFDLYPDPYCTKVKEATGIFHRHVLTRAQMRELEGDTRFNKEKILELLNNNSKGRHNEEFHETSLRSISGYTASFSIIDRYDVIEYWGLVSGRDLKAHGLPDVQDEGADYFANVWFCGGRTLMAMVSPLKRQTIPYAIVPYERIPHQIWGVGPARMIADSQKMLNAATRRLLDNMAVSSGPQFEVNTNVLAVGEDPLDIRPFKVWLRDGGDASYPMVRMFQPDNNVQPLSTLVDMFKRFADEESNIPAYTSGISGPGLNKTASGMSMLMGQANGNLKSVVSNLDTFAIVPIIQGLFDWNMEWNDEESIKGDMKVEACGITSLLAKEIQSQRLIQFAQITANPVDMQIVDRAELIREVAKSLDLDIDKLIKNEQANAAQNPSQPNGQPGGANPSASVGSPMGGLGDVPDPAGGAEQGGVGDYSAGQNPNSPR